MKLRVPRPPRPGSMDNLYPVRQQRACCPCFSACLYLPPRHDVLPGRELSVFHNNRPSGVRVLPPTQPPNIRPTGLALIHSNRVVELMGTCSVAQGPWAVEEAVGKVVGLLLRGRHLGSLPDPRKRGGALDSHSSRYNSLPRCSTSTTRCVWSGDQVQ